MLKSELKASAIGNINRGISHLTNFDSSHPPLLNYSQPQKYIPVTRKIPKRKNAYVLNRNQLRIQAASGPHPELGMLEPLFLGGPHYDFLLILKIND